MMAMVFATIFFTIVLTLTLASIAISLDEALAAIRDALGLEGAGASVRRRVRVSRPARAGVRPQPLRAAA